MKEEIISVFTTFFITNNEERQEELLFCLQTNCTNSLIKNIYILLDGNKDEETKLYITNHILDLRKIIFIHNNRIPTYGDWITVAKENQNTLGLISAFINADIYLDETIELITDYTKQTNSIVCLARHEKTDNSAIPHSAPHWSQDLWAISKENINNINNKYFINELNSYSVGVCRCDNKLAYLFAMRGWIIFNPFPQIKIYHLQKSETRSYKKIDPDIVGGLTFVSPTSSCDEPSILDVSIMPVKVGNIVKCSINKFLQKNLFPELENPVLNKKTEPKIAFFGASVTKQKDGYVSFFEKMSNHEIVQFGYGGMHLKDAGIIFVSEVCNSKPRYCFIEWFTPGIKSYKKDLLFSYLDAIVLRLLKVNCIPIFLFFRGTTTTDTFDDKVETYNLIINEYCKPNNIPYLEVYKTVNIACCLDEEILRDTVHTNQLGSKLYAESIFEYFNSTIVNKFNINTITPPKENKYCNIKSLPFEHKTTNGLEISGDAELIGILQDVGPFSCYCDVYVDDKLIHKERPIIDIHCYYTRPTINFSYSFKNKLTIKVSSKEVDYTIVKQEINWSNFSKESVFPQTNELRMHKLYYIGNITNAAVL